MNGWTLQALSVILTALSTGGLAAIVSKYLLARQRQKNEAKRQEAELHERQRQKEWERRERAHQKTLAELEEVITHWKRAAQRNGVNVDSIVDRGQH